MSHEDWTTKPGEEPIDFAATRGGERLPVQIVGGWRGNNPALMFVVLEVRLGPDYVCPQCGPAPEGPDAHAARMHTWPPLDAGS